MTLHTTPYRVFDILVMKFCSSHEVMMSFVLNGGPFETITFEDNMNFAEALRLLRFPKSSTQEAQASLEEFRRLLFQHFDHHPSLKEFVVIRHSKHDKTANPKEILAFEEVERVLALSLIRLNQLYEAGE